MRVLCRTLDQLQAAARSGVQQSVRRLSKTFATIAPRSKWQRQHGATIYLATPRIQKPGEMGIFRAMAKHGAERLSRPQPGRHGVLRASTAFPFVCDYSLNAANQWTVDYSALPRRASA